MGNLKKILKICFIYIIIATYNYKIYADGYNATEQGESNSKTAFGSKCDPGDICMNWGAYFELRISLVDKNLRQIAGTKNIQFAPYQPGVEGSFEGRDSYYDNTIPTIPIYRNGEWKRINNDYDENLYFLGSQITGSQFWYEDYGEQYKNYYFPNIEYYTYMGFGDTNEESTDFGNYSHLHDAFMKYATNVSSKKNRVEENGKEMYINFIDFFLRVSNFSDTWTSSSNYTIVDKIAKGDYYLLIEPVYHLGTTYDGHSHNIHGTSKQLALYLQGQIYGYYCEFRNMKNCGGYYPNKFAVLDERNVMYNVFCNFMDANNELFEIYENPSYECNDIFSRLYDNDISDYNALATDVFARLYQSKSPFGVSTINLSALFKNEIQNLTKVCRFQTTTCNDNDFQFDSKLFLVNDNKLVDNKNSIYGCLDNLKDDKDKYFFTTTDDQDHKLWCYDDINYDFSKLKEIEGKYNTNTLMEIPSGTLNVNRTCYSNGEISQQTLESVLVNDNITNRNNIYQNEFKFNLFGTNYTFKRNDTIQTDGTISKTNILNENNKPLGNKYIYTSNFSYDYDLNEGRNSSNLSIGIKDYNLTNGITNTNSIDFISNFEKGRTIVIKNSSKTKFINTLDAQLNNAFGLSNKPINEIESMIVNIQTETTNKTLTKSVTTNSVTIMQVSNEEDNQCELNTELDNKNALNEGIQFRVISLSNPFPSRDGTSRMPGSNWLNASENNVYEYIQNNRNVNSESVYNEKPLYKVTLDPSTMIKVREYNKNHSYSDNNIICEAGTGKMCISNFLRNEIKNLEGECSKVDSKNLKEFYKCANKTEKSGGPYILNECEKIENGRCVHTAKSGT